jgi:NADPH:quinone reductase-like Zn-dependent oxidoreductase
MSDGAGIVEAAGDGVTEFKVGDHVVSCFFPNWIEGPPPIADFSSVPGDGVDGYAREFVVAPETAFTHAPKGYSFTEAWANIPPKCNRNGPICFSPYLYRARNLIERFFNKVKQCRRVASR